MQPTLTEVNIIRIGHDQLELDTVGLTDVELLKAAREVYPLGVNLMGGNYGPVWVHPDMLLALAQSDGFGLELQGLAHSAAELLRLASDMDKAEELGYTGVDRMVKLFAAQARGQGEAKRVNQLHAVRWGVSAKFAGADNVEPGILDILPTGNVAKRLAEAFGCPLPALEGRRVLVLRHPFILSYVATIGFNEHLTKNLVLSNRLDFRRATKGDFDGDTGNMFPIADEMMAIAIASELEAAVPENDATLAVRGLAATDPEAEMWGELLAKSTDDKLAQSFTKTVDQWLTTHIQMGDFANRLTPFAYRISDIGALMAAVGYEGAREVSLMGAVIEEDFYLGLSGGPKGLDEAMETWFRQKMSKPNQEVVFKGLRAAVHHELLTDASVRNAIVKASAINRGKFDPYDAQEMLVHFGFLIGKGRVTTCNGAAEKLRCLLAIATSADTPPALRDNYIVKMAFHAARKLSQVVGKAPAEAPVEEHYDEYYESGELADYFED